MAVAGVAFFGEGYEALFAQSVMFAGFTLVFALLAVSESLKEDESAVRAGLIGDSVAVVLDPVEQLRLSGTPRRCAVLPLDPSTSGGVDLVRRAPDVFLVIRSIAGGTYAHNNRCRSRLPLYIHYVQSGLSAVASPCSAWTDYGSSAS